MIMDTVNCKIKCDDGEVEYVYNIVERKIFLEIDGKEEEFMNYGVEARSYIIKNNMRALVYKEAIEGLTPYKHKAKEFICMLRKNQVSPIHLLNIGDEVIEEYFLDFDKVVQATTL